MLKGFKEFILRGNVVDLAVAVVIGAAFGARGDGLRQGHHHAAHRRDLRQARLLALSFTINNSKFLYGSFINAVIAFVLIAAAVYFVVVAPMNAMAARRARGQDPTTRECPRVPERDPRGRAALPALHL